MLKTKKPLNEAQLKQIQGVLKKDLNGPLLELLQWINTIGSAIPKKNLYKSPFFDSQDIKEFNPWRVCPIGEHWVSRHLRQKKTMEDVDGHCRKNPSEKDLLKGEEVEKMAISNIFKNVKLKALDVIRLGKKF